MDIQDQSLYLQLYLNGYDWEWYTVEETESG